MALLVPSLKGVLRPVPARVVVVPVGEIILMRLLPVSATKTMPAGETAMPWGLLSMEAVPSPSDMAAAPVPATVVVAPVAVTLRTRWFPASATYTSPELGSQARPKGLEKLAPSPVPSPQAAPPLPASVLVTPLSVCTCLMTWLEESATRMLPGAPLVTPRGKRNRAVVPTPLTREADAPPARVVTFQMHEGSAARPGELQLWGLTQGMLGAGAPPGQELPTAHRAASLGEVDPAGQPNPAPALHTAVQEALARPSLEP